MSAPRRSSAIANVAATFRRPLQQHYLELRKPSKTRARGSSPALTSRKAGVFAGLGGGFPMLPVTPKCQMVSLAWWRFGALTTNAKPARNRRVALRRFDDEETCRGDDGTGRAFDSGTGAAGLSEPDHQDPARFPAGRQR